MNRIIKLYYSRFLVLLFLLALLCGCSSVSPSSSPTPNATNSLTSIIPPTASAKATPTPTPAATVSIQQSDPQEITVYITETGEKYHNDGCQYLSKSKIAISLEDAVADGYEPCSKCDPPILQSENAANTEQPEPAIVVVPNDQDNHDVTVYITKTGEKYHSDGCRYLSKSQIAISLSDAKVQGYTPCSVCNPPT
jgi:uncharacterized protein (DUF1330 family)